MPQDFILHVNSCLTPQECIHNASILFRGGGIVAVGGFSALRVLEEIPCVNLPNCRAVPGFIDTHLHGSGGFDAMDADQNRDMAPMSQALAMHGVTSFVPTVLSAPPQKMLAVTEALADLCHQDLPGAAAVGIHVEGPFLNPKKSGAQNIAYLREVDLGFTRELIQAGKGMIRTLTLAPELDQTAALIDLLLENGIIPSMGHSLADSQDAIRAIEAGASRSTHLFNGMPLLDQRKAGLTSIALTDDRLTIELIADGFHVHPQMVDIACRTKPRRNVVAISDATQGAGLADGIYHLGGDQIEISNGECRRVSDGRLAGSSMTLDRCLRNLIKFSSLSESEALACCTSNAANSIGLEGRGLIQPGKRGDVVVVDDNWEVQLTIVAGRVVYDRNNVTANPQ